jgi:hypothetical protein
VKIRNLMHDAYMMQRNSAWKACVNCDINAGIGHCIADFHICTVVYIGIMVFGPSNHYYS